MRFHRMMFVAVCGVLALSVVGCAKKKRSLSEAVEDKEAPGAAASAAPSPLAKFPADDAVPGSKSFPLRTITTPNLSGRLNAGPSVTSLFALVDARTRVEFENEHIPGAINVPAEQVEARLAAVVPDKSREVVFYCNGPACTKSHKAGRSATASGYSHAVVYDEGMPAWKAANFAVAGDPLPQVTLTKLAPTALRNALAAKAITVVDVRPRDEFLVFRIAGSINIALDDLEAKLKSEVKPTASICIVDYTGHQQQVTARLLAKLGYTNVKGLEEGLRGWQGAQLPVDKGLEVAGKAEAKNDTAGAKAGAPKPAATN